MASGRSWRWRLQAQRRGGPKPPCSEASSIGAFRECVWRFRTATHDEHAGAALQGGKEEDEGGRGLPQRDEREHLGNRDSVKEQRGVGAQALPWT